MLQHWRLLGLYPSEPALQLFPVPLPVHSRLLSLAPNELWKRAPGSPPPTRPPRQGPPGVGSRNKRALGEHGWALVVGAFGTFHGRNKKTKSLLWYVLWSFPGAGMERSLLLTWGPLWSRTRRRRGSGGDHACECPVAFRQRLSGIPAITFSIFYVVKCRKGQAQCFGLGKRGPFLGK